MKIRGELAQILICIAPEVYGPYIIYENLKAVIYLKLLKSLDGLLIASLLFYQNLRKDLGAIGFRVNSCDPCVANKMVRDKQMKNNRHVDDLKVSNSDKDIVDALIQWTKDTYEDVTKLNPSRGKIHDHISMTLYYTPSGEVKNYMK